MARNRPIGESADSDGGLEQFDFRIAEVKVNDARAVDIFRSAAGDAEDVAVEGERGIQVGNGDAEMGDGRLHAGEPNAKEQGAAGNMSENTMAVTDTTFDGEVSNAKGLVLVDFWAAWCGPCRMIAPTLEALAKEYAGKIKITKLDVDANQPTAMKYNVRSIPTLVFFKDGKHVDTLIGAHPRPSLEAKINQHLAA